MKTKRRKRKKRVQITLADVVREERRQREQMKVAPMDPADVLAQRNRERARYGPPVSVCPFQLKNVEMTPNEEFIALVHQAIILSASDKPILNMTPSQWPGTPGTRTVLAHDANGAEIAQAFKANPASRWVITPYTIVDKQTFKPGGPAVEVKESGTHSG